MKEVSWIVVGFWATVFVAVAPVANAQQPAEVPRLQIDRQLGAAKQLKLEKGQNRLLVLSEAIERVSVANPDVANLKVIIPTQLLLTAKGVGTTDLTLWDRTGEPLVVAVEVSRNLDALRSQIKELFPSEQIGVSVKEDLVVLTGEVADVRLPERVAEVAKLHADKVANLVRVIGDHQVQIEVKFAEVSRSNLREMGINMFYKNAEKRLVGGVNSSQTVAGEYLNTIQNPAIPGTGPRGIPPDVAAQPFGNAFSLFLSSARRGFPFSAMLSLLEGNGLAKTLAEPTLVTLSGQEAKFLAGGELPVPLASGIGQVTVLWKEFGVQLKFTPTVISPDVIHLKLDAEVSDLDPAAGITLGSYIIPGITTRQSQTTVRLGDGQSFAIAGLLSDKVRSQADQIPFLGSLPVLGALFQSKAFEREETELLVVVTARLAGPVAPHELPPMPNEHEEMDLTNFEFFFLGGTNHFGSTRSTGVKAAPVPGAGRGPSGSVGFSTESR